MQLRCSEAALAGWNQHRHNFTRWAAALADEDPSRDDGLNEQLWTYFYCASHFCSLFAACGLLSCFNCCATTFISVFRALGRLSCYGRADFWWSYLFFPVYCKDVQRNVVFLLNSSVCSNHRGFFSTSFMIRGGVGRCRTYSVSSFFSGTSVPLPTDFRWLGLLHWT